MNEILVSNVILWILNTEHIQVVRIDEGLNDNDNGHLRVLVP